MTAYLASIAAFLGANQWVYPLVTGILSVIIHSAAKSYPRFVTALQAVSLDLPKLWTAITGKTPPPVLPIVVDPPVVPAPPPPPAAPSGLNRWAAPLAAACLTLALAALASCSAATQKTVLSVEQMACVLAKAPPVASLLDARTPDAVAAIGAVCGVVPGITADVLQAYDEANALPVGDAGAPVDGGK